MPPNALANRTLQAFALARWVLFVLPMAAAVGSACALFLWALDVATRTRFDNPVLLYWLPVGGLASASSTTGSAARPRAATT